MFPPFLFYFLVSFATWKHHFRHHLPGKESCFGDYQVELGRLSVTIFFFWSRKVSIFGHEGGAWEDILNESH